MERGNLTVNKRLLRRYAPRNDTKLGALVFAEWNSKPAFGKASRLIEQRKAPAINVAGAFIRSIP
jgi:capsule polysaccharide export protein KpsC/LpsZ